MFKSILILSVLFFRANAAQVDHIDRHCVDLSVAVFQAHQQYLNDGKPDEHRIDLNRPSTYEGRLLSALPVRINRSTTQDYFSDWGEFLPIYGKTGLDHSWVGDQRKDSFVGMVGYHPSENLMVLSFRGTRENQDWWNNFNINRRKPEHINENVCLHSGYLDAFQSCIPSLMNQISSIIVGLPTEKKDCMRIAVTGHSLGGSIAASAIPFMRSCFPSQVISLRTFGSPKVGGKDYNQWLQQSDVTTKTFIRETDITPDNPSGYGLTYLGEVIKLPHYDDPWYIWPRAHDDRKYRRGIYECLGLPHDTGPTHDITVTFWGKEYKI